MQKIEEIFNHTDATKFLEAYKALSSDDKTRVVNLSNEGGTSRRMHRRVLNNYYFGHRF